MKIVSTRYFPFISFTYQLNPYFYISLLVIIVMIDHEMDENVRLYCFNLGIKMELHPHAIGEILDHLHTRGTMNSLPEEVIAIFRKYLK
jgi:hypothetical protein